MRLASAMLCFGLLVLAAACTKDATDAMDTDSNTDTGPTPQEELCADYPDNIACPTLPAPPKLEDGTDFSNWGAKSVSSWCDARLRKARLHCDW